MPPPSEEKRFVTSRPSPLNPSAREPRSRHTAPPLSPHPILISSTPFLSFLSAASYLACMRLVREHRSHGTGCCSTMRVQAMALVAAPRPARPSLGLLLSVVCHSARGWPIFFLRSLTAPSTPRLLPTAPLPPYSLSSLVGPWCSPTPLLHHWTACRCKREPNSQCCTPPTRRRS